MKNIVKFKCSDNDIFVLDTKMKLSGIKNRSEFIRKTINDSVVVEIDKQYQQKMLYLLTNIANNLNQVAKHCNTKKEIDKKALFLLDQIDNAAHKIYSKKDKS